MHIKRSVPRRTRIIVLCPSGVIYHTSNVPTESNWTPPYACNSFFVLYYFWTSWHGAFWTRYHEQNHSLCHSIKGPGALVWKKSCVQLDKDIGNRNLFHSKERVWAYVHVRTTTFAVGVVLLFKDELRNPLIVLESTLGTWHPFGFNPIARVMLGSSLVTCAEGGL